MLGLLVGRGLDRADRSGLELGQRVARVLGRELARERLAVSAQQLVDERLDLVLDGRARALAEVLLEQLGHDAGLGAEGRVDALRQLRADGPGALGELRLDLARLALELGLDVLRVGGRVLAVEHARADLDGLDDEIREVLAGVLALAGEAHGALVGQRQVLDADAVADQGDAVSEDGGGSFHDDLVAPYAPYLTDRTDRLRARGASTSPPMLQPACRTGLRRAHARLRRADPPRAARSPAARARRTAALGADGRRRLRGRRDPPPRRDRRSIDELGSLTFAEVDRRANAVATRPGRRAASGPATASRSCAATTAASSTRPPASRSSAPTRSTSTRCSRRPRSPTSCERERPVAIIHDEEFAELVADAAEGRERIVAWSDGPTPAERRRSTT